MVQEILNAVIPAAVAALAAVLAAAVKVVGDAAADFLRRKKDELEEKIGAAAYAQDLTFARDAWNMVDEKFRISPQLTATVAAKQAEFAATLQKMIPGVTDDEIEQLRQAVAGEVNKGKAAIAADPTENTPAA